MIYDIFFKRKLKKYIEYTVWDILETDRDNCLKLLKSGNINEQDEYGQTILTIITQYEYRKRDYNDKYYKPNRDEKIIKGLLRRGANPNLQDSDGWTPLHYAVIKSVYETNIIEILLKEGADPNIADIDGMTPLMLIAQYSGLNFNYEEQLPKIAKLLLEHGADPNIQDKEGKTALYYAIKSQYWLAKLLIKHGADINLQDEDGNSLLMTHILEYGYIELINFIIESGADINLQNKVGDTALMLAIKNRKSKELVKKLIELGADINIKNKLGDAPLFYALRNHDYKLAKFLIEHGADLNLRDDNGETPLMMINSNHFENERKIDNSEVLGWKRTGYDKDLILKFYSEENELLELIAKKEKEQLETQQQIQLTNDPEIDALIKRIASIIKPLDDIEEKKILNKVNALVIKYEEDKNSIQPTLETKESTPTLSLGKTELTLKNELINSLQVILNTLNKEEKLINLLSQINEYISLMNSKIEIPSRTENIYDKLLYIIGIHQKYQNELGLNKLKEELDNISDLISKRLKKRITGETELTTLGDLDIESTINEKISKQYENAYKYHTCLSMIKESTALSLVKKNINILSIEDQKKFEERIKEIENILTFELCENKSVNELIELVKNKIESILTDFKKIAPRSMAYKGILEDLDESLGIYNTEKEGKVESKVREMEEALNQNTLPKEVVDEIQKEISDILKKWKEKIKSGEEIKLENSRFQELSIDERKKIELEILSELSEVECRLKKYQVESERVSRGI